MSETIEERHKTKETISNFDTFMHLIKGNVGAGILAMPYAIRNGGLIFGSLGLLCLLLICVYCMHLIVLSSRILRHRLNVVYLTFGETAEKSIELTKFSMIRNHGYLPKLAKYIINVFICMTQLGFCTVYIVFVSTNIKSIVDIYSMDKMDIRIFSIFLLIPIILMCSLKNFMVMAPFMVLANGFMFLGLVLIFFFLFQDIPPLSQRNLIASPDTWGLYFGTTLYTFESIGLILPLEREMTKRKDMIGCFGILNKSMTCIACLYISTGVFGYLRYGEKVEASITTSILHDHPCNLLAQVISIMLSIAVFFSYAIQFYVPFKLIYSSVEPYIFPGREFMSETVVRCVIILITFAFAILFPDLSLLMSLVGAISSTTLALLAPPIIHVLVLYPKYGKFHYKLWIDCFIFIVGMIGFVTGTYKSFCSTVKG